MRQRGYRDIHGARGRSGSPTPLSLCFVSVVYYFLLPENAFDLALVALGLALATERLTRMCSCVCMRYDGLFSIGAVCALVLLVTSLAPLVRRMT